MAGNPFTGALGNPFRGALAEEEDEYAGQAWVRQGPLLVRVNPKTGKKEIRVAPPPKGALQTVKVKGGVVYGREEDGSRGGSWEAHDPETYNAHGESTHRPGAMGLIQRLGRSDLGQAGKAVVDAARLTKAAASAGLASVPEQIEGLATVPGKASEELLRRLAPGKTAADAQAKLDILLQAERDRLRREANPFVREELLETETAAEILARELTAEDERAAIPALVRPASPPPSGTAFPVPPIAPRVHGSGIFAPGNLWIRDQQANLGARREDFIESAAAGLPDAVAAPLGATAEATGIFLGDPTNWVPALGGFDVLAGTRFLRGQVSQGVRLADEIIPIDDVARRWASGLSDEDLATVRRAKGLSTVEREALSGEAQVRAIRARHDPALRLAETPGQRAVASAQGREVVAPPAPVAARNTGVGAAESSPRLGISAVEPGERLFVYRDEAGEEIASLIARQDPDGFRVRHVFVEEAARGQGIPEQLYRQAHAELGPYRGSTDYAGRRTPAGERMAERLQATAPEIFGGEILERPPAPDPGLLGRAAPGPGPAGELRPVESPAPGVPGGESGFVSTEPLRKLADWWSENFSGGGPGQGRFNVAARQFADPAQRELVKGIPSRIERMQGRHAAALFDKGQLLKEADRVAREVAPSRKGRRELYRNMQRAINGDLPIEEIPAPMRPFLGRANDLVEQLSWKGVDEGALPAEIVTGGRYRHTAYRAFEDPDWINKVRDTPDWYAARDYLKKELPNAPDDEILGIMMQLAHREHGPEAITLVAQGAPTRINAILKPKLNIPEPLRRLMGEYDDFRVALEKTVHNLAWDIESYRFWKELGDNAVAAGVFREKGAPATELLYRSLPGSNSVGGISSRSPVEGMLTSDSLKQALLAQFEATKVSGWQKLAGVVKSNKTVLSLQTHGRNALSHTFSVTANGHAPRIAVRLPEYIRAFRSQATRRRAVELGITGDGALSGEVQDYIRWMEESANPLVRGQKWVAKKAANLYRLEDDVPRYLQWMAETEDRMWALGISRPEAEVLAADIIRDTAQTYSRAPQMARRLSRNPVVGSPGVTFTFESLRNVKNIARQGARDLAEGVRTGNGRLIALAGKRYAGLVGGSLAASATVTAIRDRVAGMDAGEEAALRRLVVPHYNKNAQLVPVGFARGESVTYFDMGFINPYSAILKPAIAAQRTIDGGAPATGVLWELLNGFAGGDILAETMAEAAFGQRVSQMWPPEMGGKTYLKSDPDRYKLAEIAQTIYRGAAPGTALTAERILRAYEVLPNRSRSGQVFEPGKEWLALAGPRVTKLEIPTAYRRTMGEVGGLLEDILSMAKLNARESGPQAAAERYLGNYVALYQAAREAAQDGRSLGMDDVVLREMAQTVPADVLRDAIDGIAKPPMPRLKNKNPADDLLILQIEAAYLRKYR